MIVSAGSSVGPGAVLGRFGLRDVTAGVGPGGQSVAALVDGRPPRSRLPRVAGGVPTYRLLGHGADYAFLRGRRPGAAAGPSRRAWQPHGVHGASRVYDHARFAWTDACWRGVALPGSVVYELHVGDLHRRGDAGRGARAARPPGRAGGRPGRADAGGAFPGRHGWGYDGVHLFAVHEPYGGPDALKRFVDACHARGLGVVLDVVYNHLGPSGNYLPRFGPYFTGQHETPWGTGINLDDDGRRRGAALGHRQRADVAARLPPRRAAAGRRARPGRRLAGAPAGGAVARGRRALRRRTPAADPDGGVRPQPAAHGDAPSRPAGWA